MLYALVSVAGAEQSVGQLRRVSGEADRAQSHLNRLSQNAAQVGKGMHQVAGGLVRVGTYAAVAAVTAAGAGAKIAASFQDAFAAVEKTLEGASGPELEKIDRGLRTLSTQIPVTYQGLASIAAEAGALGVKTRDIENFTEAVARTSAATVGLTEFDASEAFGKLSTIFGLTGQQVHTATGAMVSDYERLGSTLVALGNAGASSEADIIAVTKRFASVAQSAHLSAAEVLGWSSALASLGPEAEAAGGALQRVFARTSRNIGLMDVKGEVGSNARDRVKVFARVTGMTVDQFVSAYAKDSSTAMLRVIQGLGGLDKFQLEKSLFQMGIVNIRDINAIEAFTRRYGVLTNQLNIANDAWEKGTALQEVSDKRFNTMSAHWTEFVNLVKVAAAEFGDGLNPALGRLIDKAKVFINLHMGDLRKLGTDIGDAIDRIDWREVEDGAKTVVDLLKDGYAILEKIPSKLLLIGGGFLGINRLSGGLIGAGLGNIAGGLGKAVLNIVLAGLTRGGVGSAAGAGAAGGLANAIAQRVFVVNWPPGMGAGGLGAANPLGGPAAAGFFTRLTRAMSPFLRFGALIAGSDLLLNSNAAPPGQFSETGFLGNVAGGALVGGAMGGPMGALLGALFGVGKGVIETESTMNTTLAERTHATLDENLRVNKQTNDTLNSQLGAIDSAIYRLQNDWGGLLQLTSGNSINELQQMRAEVVAKLAELNATTASNRSGSPDDRDEAAQRKRDLATNGAKIAGKVPNLEDFGKIGSKEDPFGYVHLKTLSLGQIPKGDNMKTELVYHLKQIDGAIKDAEAKGDPATVQKLTETKAGLESLLRDVKDGSFRAGDKAYQGALNVVAAQHATHQAILSLPASIAAAMRGLLPTFVMPNSSGSPDERDERNTTSSVSNMYWTGTRWVNTDKLMAAGDVGLATTPMRAMFGEAGTEGVAVIRNPRPFDPDTLGGNVSVDVRPAPVRLMLNGRDIVSGVILADAFVRRPAGIG